MIYEPYTVDEFIDDTIKTSSIDNCARKKVSLLFDFGILNSHRIKDADDAYKWLANMHSEEEMTRAIHDIIRCDDINTARKMLKTRMRKGVSK